MRVTVSLRAGSHNYIAVHNIRKWASGVLAVPSSITVAAEIATTKGGSAITNSSINLSAVSGATDAMEGTFPATVSLTGGTDYWIKITVTADSLTFVDYYQTTAID